MRMTASWTLGTVHGAGDATVSRTESHPQGQRDDMKAQLQNCLKRAFVESIEALRSTNEGRPSQGFRLEPSEPISPARHAVLQAKRTRLFFLSQKRTESPSTVSEPPACALYGPLC